MVKTENFKKLEISTADELRKWLIENHAQKESMWLVTYKKVVPDKHVSTSEVLDELLCFGWIDGVRRKLDEKKTMQLISPRKSQHWTNTYKERFAKLLKADKIAPAGNNSVQLSKELGLWNFMDDVDALIKPTDFLKALQDHMPALTNFDTFGSSSQRFMLRWIKLSKTAGTREKRIKEIAMLAQNNSKLPGS